MIFNLKIVARIPILQINGAHAWNFMSATTLLESKYGESKVYFQVMEAKWIIDMARYINDYIFGLD